MQGNTLLKLVLTAVASIIITIFVIINAPSYKGDINTGKVVFPDLIENINNVSKISIKTNSYEVNLLKENDGWKVKEANNYPAEEKRVRNVLIGMAQLEYLEKKTNNPARYEEIQLNDITNKNSKAREIIFTDNKNNIVAQITAGLKKLDLQDAGEAIYFRKADEKQSWLGKTNMDATGNYTLWIVRPLFNIPNDEIRKIKLTSPSGYIFSASRNGKYSEMLPDDKNVILTNPEKKELEEIVSALEELDFKTAKKDIAKIFENKENIYTTEYVTFSGLIIKIEAKEYEGRYWIKTDIKSERIPKKGYKEIAEKMQNLQKDWAYNIRINDVRPLLTTIEPKIKK